MLIRGSIVLGTTASKIPENDRHEEVEIFALAY